MKYFLVILIACHVNLLFVTSVDLNVEQDEATFNESSKQSTQVPTTSTIVDHIKPPTILIVSLFRNKAHIMPSFFTYLNRIDYPKNRISLW